MTLRRIAIQVLAIIAMPVVEEATLRIHRRRGVEAAALGIGGIFNEPFYQIFGPRLTRGVADAVAVAEDPQPDAPAFEPSPQDPRPSAEVVQFDRRSAF